MPRRQKEPLRPLTPEERAGLLQMSRAQSEPASHVARAQVLLAVADGQSFTAAAKVAGRRSGDAVAHWVKRFNLEGLMALEAHHGGGPPVEYGPAERERILAEVRRTPDREQDGTATWSLSTLQRALRTAPDGLPEVSTYTLWVVLREAGWSRQRTGSWWKTGQVKRKRKSGVVEVTDPDAVPKKT